MKKSFKTALGLPILAMATSLLAGCGSNRNNFAYDLDFNVDVKGYLARYCLNYYSRSICS